MTPLDALARSDGLHRGERVLCALSGGADSVCLTHALCALADSRGWRIAAAHFSHGLRPQAAARERAFCSAFCQGLSIPLFCGEGDAPALMRAQGMSAEQAARTLRYAFLERTAAQWGASAVATGHTRDDQAETVLFRLVRGSGSRGLAGMRPRRGLYARPLLAVSRAEVEQYLRTHGLSHIEDESNADRRYARNRLRLDVLPALERVHPGAKTALASAADLLAQDDDCLSALAASLVCGCEASASALAAAHPALAGRAVQALWRAAGGTAELYRRQVDSVLALCASAAPSGRVALHGGMAAWREYDRLHLGLPPQQQPPPAPQALVPNVPLRFGGWEVRLCDPAEDGAPTLPKQALDPPFVVRTRAEGDAIALPGGRRSVKRLLVDRRIPKQQRDSLPVVCDGLQVLAVGDTVCALPPADGGRVSLICRRTEE